MLEARSPSPIERNWLWTPPLEHNLRGVSKPQTAKLHDAEDIPEMSERVVADDSVLPTLLEESAQPWVLSVLESRPVQARSGPEMMQQFGLVESDEGSTVILQ